MNDISISLNKPVVSSFGIHNIPGLYLLTMPEVQKNKGMPGQSVLVDYSNGGSETGEELLVNGDFSAGLAGWETSDNWQIINNRLTSDSQGEVRLFSEVSLENNKGYTVKIHVTRLEYGILTFTLGNSVPCSVASSGEFIFYVKPENGMHLRLAAIDANVEISYISVKKLTGNYGVFSAGMPENQDINSPGILFNGTSDFIDFGNIFSPADNDFVVFTWIQLEAGFTSTGKMELIAAGNELQLVTIDTGGEPGYYLTSGNNRTDKISSGINDGNWHFVCLIHKHNGETYLNLDNKEVTSPNTNVLSTLDTSESLLIGKYSYGRYFTGRIGISGILFFDGTDSRPSSLPDNIENIIADIYNYTKMPYS